MEMKGIKCSIAQTELAEFTPAMAATNLELIMSSIDVQVQITEFKYLLSEWRGLCTWKLSQVDIFSSLPYKLLITMDIYAGSSN
jgi:hypothetical protein